MSGNIFGANREHWTLKHLLLSVPTAQFSFSPQSFVNTGTTTPVLHKPGYLAKEHTAWNVYQIPTYATEPPMPQDRRDLTSLYSESLTDGQWVQRL